MPLYRNNKFVVDVYRNNKVVQKIYRGATLVYGAIEEVLVNISGKILTLVNGARVESLDDFKIYGKSTQDGTPTPTNSIEIKSVENPIVKFSGKNLIDANYPKGKDTSIDVIDGEAIQQRADTREFLKFKLQLRLNGSVIKYVFLSKNIYSPTKIEGSFVKDSSFNEIRFGHDGITRDVCVFYDISHLVDGKTYTFSCYIANATQGQFVFKDIQIEEGSVATDYEPYHTPQSYQFNHTLYGIPVSSGGNYTDESGQQWIADYVDVETHFLTNRVKKFIITGNENWEQNGNRFVYYSNLGSTQSMPCLCTHYLWSNSSGWVLENNTMKLGNGSYPIIRDDRFSNVNEFKAFAKSQYDIGKPIEILYIPNVSTDSQLTDSEVQTFLQMKTYKPTTIVSNNYDAHMSTSYHTKLEQLDVAMTREYNNLINELKGE